MNININQIIPSHEDVFTSMGINPDSDSSKKLKGILHEAFQLFTSLADPVSFASKIELDKFTKLYNGEGQNDEDNVLMHIYPRSKNLELFALTLGEKVSTKIEHLFEDNDYPMGYMLDLIASITAENATVVLQDKNLENLKKDKLAGEDTRILSYSPGYCGWHISGQKKLFAHLKPEKIGITLNASFLMTPLKSVSGVLVAGRKDIHLFKPNYPFCKSCKTHSCLQRMKEIKIM